MNPLLWVATVLLGAASIATLVDGHLAGGFVLLLLSTLMGLSAAVGTWTNLE